MEKKDIFSSWILRICDGVTGFFFFLVSAALFFMSAFSTCFIDKYEMSYFLPDSPWLKLLECAFLLAALIFLCVKFRPSVAFIGRINSDAALFAKLKRRLLLAIWFLVSLWVVCTQVPANADQRFTMMAARSIAQGDFSNTGPYSYLYIYNNQIGWTMVIYLLDKLFGPLNYAAYQLLMAGLTVLILNELTCFGALLGMSRAKQLAVIVLGAAFVPLALYSSFIYGTIPGLWLSLAAIRLEIQYFRDGRLRHGILSALCIALAVMVKMNYLIFMAAMLIYALLEAFGKKGIKKLMIVLFMAVFYVVQARVPVAALENISGKPVPQGCATLSWVAMGLQDGERPGWYNQYNENTFAESSYDVHEQIKWVKSDIKYRIGELLSDLDYARNFFVKKTASQWNEPTFQSVWVSINHYQDAYRHGVMSVDNSWPQGILSPMGNHKVTLYMNHLSFLMLVGCLLYSLLCSAQGENHYRLILAMVVVGGFLFHLVWEVKGQYALPYYVLLLPYTVMGYSKAAECLAALPAALRNGGIHIEKKTLIGNAALLLLALAILCYVFHGTLPGITGDTEAYYAYLASHS